MSEYIRFSRLPIFLLALFMGGRFVLGGSGIAYERGTWIFSMVVLSWLSAFYFAGFSRRMRGYKWYQGMLVGATIALSAQILIFLATLISYVFGAETYFNHPTALNVDEAVGLGQALGIRVFGLIVNTIMASIVGLLGWVGGKLIPESS